MLACGLLQLPVEVLMCGRLLIASSTIIHSSPVHWALQVECGLFQCPYRVQVLLKSCVVRATVTLRGPRITNVQQIIVPSPPPGMETRQPVWPLVDQRPWQDHPAPRFESRLWAAHRRSSNSAMLHGFAGRK